MPRRITVVTLILLTFAAIAGAQPSAAPGAGAPPRRPPALYQNLPEPVTSFGAALVGDGLYIYSGHVGEAHDHSAANLSTQFHHLKLDGRSQWKSVAAPLPLQGFAVVSDGKWIYRIGGLSARNASLDEKADLYSVNDCARFDPRSGQWEALPPLPVGRSSHEAVVDDGRLYVVGGWTLRGKDAEPAWIEDVLMLDLERQPLQWRTVAKAPFRRRAIAAAALNGRLYALGGITDDGTSHEVDVLELETGRWSKGPDLPVNDRMKGFGSAAAAVGGNLWFSGRDGRVLRLDAAAQAWRDTGHQLTTPRFFHRMLVHGEKLLFVGGAGQSGHLADIEAVELSLLEAPASAVLPLQPQPRAAPDQAGAQVWAAFRGDGTSRSRARNLPIEWGPDRHVAWSVDLPGHGQSSPVVWHDRVFITSIEGPRQETLRVACLRLTDGGMLWQHTFASSQPVESSGYVSKAAPTPAVDDQRLYVFFESGNLLAFDHDGRVLWQRSLTSEYGPMKGNHGLGGSVALTERGLVVLVDHDGPSYLLSIDKKTGENIWKQEREARVSWSSPIVAGRGEAQRIVLSSNGRVEEIDAATGRQVWFIDGIEGNTVPSASVTDDLVVVGTSEVRSSVAIRRGGSGQLDSSDIVWRAEKASCTFNSPLVHRGRIYYVNRAGVAFCVEEATGKLVWTLRLPSASGGCWASAIAAGDLVYFFCKDGSSIVIREGGDEAALVARNQLDVDDVLYGVAAVDGRLVLRFGGRVVCVSQPERPR